MNQNILNRIFSSALSSQGIRQCTLALAIAVAWLFQSDAVASATSDKGEQEFAKGWDLLKQEKYAEARAQFEIGLGKNPTNSLGHFYLGEACRGLREWACSEDHYQRSVEIDSNSSTRSSAQERLEEARGYNNLPKLEGRWKYRGEKAVYRATVSNHENIEMHLEKLTRDQHDFGVKAGLRAFIGFKVISRSAVDFISLSSSLQSSLQPSNLIFAKGQLIPFTSFDKGKGCSWTLGLEPVEALLAIDLNRKIIRIIRFQTLTRNPSCEIERIDSTSLSEMVRVIE